MTGDMSNGVEYGPELVKRAAAGLLAVRPTYRQLVGFYGDIFALQEEARARVRLEPFRLPPDLVEVKIKNHFPLIQVTEMRFDLEAGQTLFADLCRVAIGHRSGLSEPADILIKHSAEISHLFKDLLGGYEVRLKKAADDFRVGADALSFFLYHSLRPSVCRCEQDLSRFLIDTLSWEKGYCPICGSPPALTWLEEDGKRSLFCSFCWHRWPSRRAVCPLCGNADPSRLSYLYSEEEKEYRVDLCDACRKYLKTVDSRLLARPSYPPLEHIGCLHLDIKASEAGYTSVLESDPAEGVK